MTPPASEGPAAESPHILIVDDEEDFREVVIDYFALQGFLVHEAGNGTEMREVLAYAPVQVVLLDLRMPGEDGFALCRWLRENARLGIIMLTGSNDTVDKVVGLEMGADDYVAKTSELRELLARVKSVLRRVGPQAVHGPAAAQPPAAAAAAPAAAAAAPEPAARAADGPAEIAFGPCRLNLLSRTLETADGEPVALSAMEFDLLMAFVERPNRVLTRVQLLELAHNRDWEPFDRSIDVRIARLRKKIEPDPARPTVIKTVRGVGYLYAPEGAR